VTIECGTSTPVPAEQTDVEVGVAVRDLLAGLTLEPWGQVTPSVYETGRLVTLAPWLTGHTERLRYLLREQRSDGGWGAPGGYSLVPTLSATEALLATVCGPDGGPRSMVADATLTHAADRGLRALSSSLMDGSGMSVPDLPAVDLTVPAMLDQLNGHLDRLGDSAPPGLDAWRGARLALPAGMTSARLATIRQWAAAGVRMPDKLLHALEVMGSDAPSAAGVKPEPPGTIGGSPAATAAWLGDPGRDGAARRYLEEVAGRQGGPVPCATPITVFERAWVLSALARVGIAVTVPPTLLDALEATLGPVGTAAGPGLPADADTTSVTLYALGLLGRPTDPASLLAYDTGSHFCTWQGEDGFSITTNAHVLDAFGHHLATSSGAAPRYPAVVDRLSAWLREQQRPEGEWVDRWHASPYYATACSVLALDRYGRGTGVAEAVDRAIDWVVDTQRPDGSWGRWSGTVEETSYALHVLLGTAVSARRRVAGTAVRGYAYLLAAAGRQADPPLWHDKDLYRPIAIVRASTLAARHLLRRRSDLLTSANLPIQRVI
jgi:halimadienyl-diphosphate synthase